MKRFNVWCILACLGLFSVFISCSKIFPTEPGPSPEFRKMEIRYTLKGGWSDDTAKLDIFGNGTVQKSGWSGEISQGILTTTQQDSLIQLFSNFSQYDPNYSANVTDSNYNTIVYIYEGKTKTVTVYAPHSANIPESLQNVITYLRALLFN